MGDGPTERVWSWFNGAPQGPAVVWLNPTMACNLNCKFCRRQDDLPEFYRTRKELSDEKYLEIVGDAVDLGVKFLGVKGGGEPLIRRRLFQKLIPAAKRTGSVETALITNGTLLDDTLADLFAAHRWDQVTISLDGADAATHDYIREKSGVFDRVLAALARLAAAKRRHRSEKPFLQFHVVLTNRVHASLDRVIRLAAEHGVQGVEVDSLAPDKPTSQELVMSAADVKLFQERLPDYAALAERLGVRHNLRGFMRAEEVSRGALEKKDFAPAPAAGAAPTPFDGVPCFLPWYFVSINPAGGLSPCCYGESDRSAVTLHETSFRNAWLNGGMKEFRDSMLDGSMKPFCRNCTAHYVKVNAETRADLRAHGERVKKEAALR